MKTVSKDGEGTPTGVPSAPFFTGRLVDRMTPRSRTTELRFISLFLFVLAFAGAVFQLMSIGSDELVWFSLKQGVTVDASLVINGASEQLSALHPLVAVVVGNFEPSDGARAALTATEQIQLVPQLDVSIGWSRACSGSQCHDRSSLPEVIPMMWAAYDAVQVRGGLKPETLQTAYTRLIYQFATGFNVSSETCRATGASSPQPTSVATLSRVGIAAGSIAFAFLCASFLLSAYLAFLFARVNVLSAKTGLYLDLETQTAKFGAHNVGLDFLRKEIEAHLKHEAPVIFALAPSVLVSLVFSVCSMTSGVSLYESRLRCGTSVCRAFRDASTTFFHQLSTSLPPSDVIHQIDCGPGISFGTAVVAFVLSIVAFILVITLVVLYWTSDRRGSLLRRSEALGTAKEEIREMEKVAAAAAGRRRADSLTRRHSISAANILGARQATDYRAGNYLEPGGDTVYLWSRVPSGRELAMMSPTDRNDDLVLLTPQKFDHVDRLLRQHEYAVPPGMEHTLGGRIVLLRQRKSLMREEQNSRAEIQRAQGAQFNMLMRKVSRN